MKKIIEQSSESISHLMYCMYVFKRNVHVYGYSMKVYSITDGVN